MTYLLVASAALGGILLFLLAAASANTSIFASHYPLLLILNAVIAAALLGLVGYQLVTLRRALEGGCSAPGSRSGCWCCSPSSPWCRERSSTPSRSSS